MNSFGSRGILRAGGASYTIYRLDALERSGQSELSRLPFSLKVLLENLLREESNGSVSPDDIEALAGWNPKNNVEKEIAFSPARILMQDFTGVPAIVDLAAMRDAMQQLGGDPTKINPQIPVDLVIDHSVQVDRYGDAEAYRFNTDKEYERNQERYAFLRWGQNSFQNFRVVPPGTGICHQVNLEYLGQVVFTVEYETGLLAYPDSLVGTDSHTTMINGLGILGWGVGGIEAEAAMLGQPISILIPEVVGFRLIGELSDGTTATDLVLTVTQILRQKGVVGKFVEYCGPGLTNLTLADRATLANMSPEYGATIGFFPVDDQTLTYLRATGRDEKHVALVEAYTKEQGLFRTEGSPEPLFSDVLELDLSTVEPSIAGPKRPQDRVLLKDVKKTIEAIVPDFKLPETQDEATLRLGEQEYLMRNGCVVIAAITSCTNTSNPTVMLAAGLLAKKAVERGLKTKPWVKTSLAPGSKVVTDYLKRSGLLMYLEKLSFNLVGYGCTTCIGNSGLLSEKIAQGIEMSGLVAMAVLSGNRNFEGRVNPHTRANFLMSPPLVVAYALTGKMDIDFTLEPLGHDSFGNPIFLKDIWPSSTEIQAAVESAVNREMFVKEYAEVFAGDDRWLNLKIPEGEIYAWDLESTYIKQPPFFAELKVEPDPLRDIIDARVLLKVGDSVTTDHISPAGAIPEERPAGQYLVQQGVPALEFNSFGSRRGNHEVMKRGTFGNIRLRNQLVPEKEGDWTLHFPDETLTSIFDAALRYHEESTPLIVLAGKEYGTGSSRDWAAKGTRLLGVKAVIAESFERIHRSNLVGMGVLPLQFFPGQNCESFDLDGMETFRVTGIAAGLEPGGELHVMASVDKGSAKLFSVRCRIDTPEELNYFRHGGILQYVIRQLLG
ncbi:MAG: aconitate hydratase AcnA [Candidatus Aminicenantes bacterium]|nr:aconitate hydratase AcnA [Candidatus Aminicenantes bacterium]